MKTVSEWKQVLRGALTDAMRARRSAAMTVLREALAALDNAEAADLASAPRTEAGVIAGGVAGVGAGEVARRSLTPEDARAVLERECLERQEAAASLEALGRGEEAARLREQLAVLRALL